MTNESDSTDASRTVDDVVEHAKKQVETYAASAEKREGESAAFFAGLRAAYADLVNEFGDTQDFNEALRRGSEAATAVHREDNDD